MGAVEGYTSNVRKGIMLSLSCQAFAAMPRKALVIRAGARTRHSERSEESHIRRAFSPKCVRCFAALSMAVPLMTNALQCLSYEVKDSRKATAWWPRSGILA